MPGYGVREPDAGTGLLPWSWAVKRLEESHDYWVATTWPGRPPHVMPVWGVWRDGAIWFSSGLRSRKARNLARDARCTVTTDDALNPVVVQGMTSRVTDLTGVQAFVDAVNVKYDTDYGIDFFDPELNRVYRVEPTWAFGLLQDDFEGSPTRWTFPAT
jgi:pyridoxamine 5'-phosphate oxidase-like protein